MNKNEIIANWQGQCVDSLGHLLKGSPRGLWWPKQLYSLVPRLKLLRLQTSHANSGNKMWMLTTLQVIFLSMLQTHEQTCLLWFSFFWECFWAWYWYCCNLGLCLLVTGVWTFLVFLIRGPLIHSTEPTPQEVMHN